MNSETRMIKLIFCFFIIFMCINLFSYSKSFATSTLPEFSSSSSTLKPSGIYASSKEKDKEKKSDEGNSNEKVDMTIKPKTKLGATIGKTLVAVVEVFIAGFFSIKFAITGIQYFVSVSASEKADNKNKLFWTLCFGVLAYLVVYIFSYAFGLNF